MSLMTDATEQREGTTGGTRVLVVDDEPSITDLVATVLRYEGFEVDVAANGWDALRKAGAFGPDLVILDIMLPDHDGFEIHRRLPRPGARRPRHLPHGPRRHRGQGPRPDPRRRRLRHEAVQPGGAGGPDPGRA